MGRTVKRSIAELRAHANKVPGYGHIVAHEMVDEIEELRAKVLWECTACRDQPEALGPGCSCAHAPCIHDRNGEIAKLKKELESYKALAFRGCATEEYE